MARAKGRLNAIAIIAFTLLGLCLLLYPTVSNYWNDTHRSDAKVEYDEAVRVLDEGSKQALWEEAVLYNEQLLASYNGEDVGELPDYNSVLDISTGGTMSVIHIPKINVHIPVRHGTDDAMLQNYIGHMPLSSLPVGGVGTHCVLVGHRGLPSSVLFTDLDLIEPGDIFVIETLGEKLAYQVDQITTVLPSEVDALTIDKDADLCTLVTCTPYGVNSHRLLVRGHRVVLSSDEIQQAIEEPSPLDNPMLLMIGLGVGIVVVLVILARPRRKKEE